MATLDAEHYTDPFNAMLFYVNTNKLYLKHLLSVYLYVMYRLKDSVLPREPRSDNNCLLVIYQSYCFILCFYYYLSLFSKVVSTIKGLELRKTIYTIHPRRCTKIVF